MRKSAILLLPLLLSACVRDSDTYYINGRDHSITVRMEQRYFWDKKAELSLIANRLPDCQRRTALADVELEGVEYDLIQADETVYVLRGGEQQWAVSSESCELLDTVPAGGQKLGTFKLEGEDVKFEALATAQQPQAGAAAE
jgi:hypothetical protein